MVCPYPLKIVFRSLNHVNVTCCIVNQKSLFSVDEAAVFCST
jgi:hypothetical protein